MKKLSFYKAHMIERVRAKFGEEYALDNEELIECAARNKRLLDRFDSEIDEKDLTVIMVGSMGQQKEDINPIIKHRNDVAKLYADNLDALMLTPRARYKKKEADEKLDKDPMLEYLSGIN